MAFLVDWNLFFTAAGVAIAAALLVGGMIAGYIHSAIDRISDRLSHVRESAIAHTDQRVGDAISQRRMEAQREQATVMDNILRHFELTLKAALGEQTVTIMQKATDLFMPLQRQNEINQGFASRVIAIEDAMRLVRDELSVIRQEMASQQGEMKRCIGVQTKEGK